GIRHKKSCFQSRSSETSFGDSRGVSGLFNLAQSTDSLKSHLCLIHLSKESFTEGELIFARAGLFDVEDSVVAKCGSAQSIGTLMGNSGVKVQCASIRHTLAVIPKGPFLRCMAFYRGLDNTAAEGADGFKDFLQIIDELESTTYRNHCEEDDKLCSHSHSHNMKCEDCEKLKSVLEEVKGAISDYTIQLGRFQAEDYLYEAKNAAAKIFEWRGHIEIPFFPTTARRTASARESNGGNDGSSYQCPEPGCDEDFKTQADLDFHMKKLVHHVSPVPTSMT
ncbi:unnamed protein product, partial [Pocillopora meandrina]